MCCKIYILHLKYFIAIIMFTYNTMVFYKVQDTLFEFTMVLLKRNMSKCQGNTFILDTLAQLNYHLCQSHFVWTISQI